MGWHCVSSLHCVCVAHDVCVVLGSSLVFLVFLLCDDGKKVVIVILSQHTAHIQVRVHKGP